MIDEFEHPEEPNTTLDIRHANKGLESKAFKDQLALHNRCAEQARMVGMADPKEEIASLVLLEMRHIDSYELAQCVAGLVREWHKERNPYAIDWAMTLCKERHLQIPPSLAKVGAEVAEARFKGDLSGTSKQLIKRQHRDQAFIMMMNLIYFCKETRKAAASKTAARYAICFPDENLKASTLEKDYAREVRNTGIEKKHHDAWEAAENQNDPDIAQARRYWASCNEMMPMADWETTGVRR